MKTAQIKLYTFDELSDEAKEKARQWYREASAYDEWYESTYKDAKTIGLKITGFDTGRGNDITGTLLQSADEVIAAIEKEHGKTCDTYKTAQYYKKELSEATTEEEQEEVTDEFRRALLEDYLVMLRNELEYIESDEYVDGNIEANEYTFLEDGKRFSV